MFHISENYLQRDVQNLSGGEKQRIALIRNLLFTRKILLLDEVTSALDVDNTLIVENVISSINDEGTKIIWIIQDAVYHWIQFLYFLLRFLILFLIYKKCRIQIICQHQIVCVLTKIFMF